MRCSMKKMKKDSNVFSLCWDCAYATDPDACEWSGNAEPVPGWKAEQTTLRITKDDEIISYHVSMCPKFKRDSVAGGQEPCLMTKPHHITIDDKDARNIASAIVTQAVNDWINLDYGKKPIFIKVKSTVERDEVLDFFFSNRFAALLSIFSQYTPRQIRRAIRITDDMDPRLKEGVKK